MVISGLTENANRIKNANFISAGDGIAGLITDFAEEVNEKGITYTFSGVELKGLASKRIIMPPDGSAYLTYTNQSPEYVMANLIASQLINSSAERKFNGSIADFTEGTDKITFNGRFDALDEVLSNLAETYAIGWYADITVDGNIVWHIYHGINRSIEQSDNNKFILSYDYDTLQTSNLQTTKTIPNTAVVGGQGEGVDRSIAMVGGGSGLNRGEIFVDARDVENAAELPQRGQEKLAEYGDNTIFEITLSPLLINQYRKTFDLGDIGTIQTAAFAADCVLSEITEVYEGGALLRIDTVFGYDKQTIKSAVQRMTSNADTLVKVEGNTSGGGGTGGTTNYNDLSNKPKINGNELSGNKTSNDLGLAPASHTHDDRYYTETEVDTKLNSKANTNHTHDDRYYTETEMVTKLNGKANTNHTHSYNSLTDKPSIPTKTSDLTNDENFATEDYVDQAVAGASGGGGKQTTFYCTCTTVDGTAAKALTPQDGFTEDDVVEGTVLFVKFSYANTAASPRFTLNGTSIGYIRKYGTTASLAYMWYMGETVEFVYDGSYWQMVRGHAADTTYYGVTKLTNTISNSTTMALTPKAVYDFVEEGTWTPTVTGTSTYGSRRGWYSKVGDVVTIGWTVNGTFSTSTTTSTTFTITGLPFTNGDYFASGGGVVYNCWIKVDGYFVGWAIGAGESRIQARTAAASHPAGGIALGTGLYNNPGATYTVSGSITYSIA